LNCCDDFGRCNQGHGCPARCTPVHILEFGQQKPEDSPSDAAIADDSQVLTYTQIARGIQVLAVITLIWAVFLIWCAYEIVTGPTVPAIQEWGASAAQWLVSVIPMTPFF